MYIETDCASHSVKMAQFRVCDPACWLFQLSAMHFIGYLLSLSHGKLLHGQPQVLFNLGRIHII